MTFSSDAYDEIRSLKEGGIVSYGEIARRAESPRSGQVVGNVLSNPDNGELPWWRVVKADGRLVPGRESEQEAKLLTEDIVLGPNGKVSRRQIIRP